jgi:hypothetical protein
MALIFLSPNAANAAALSLVMFPRRLQHRRMALQLMREFHKN